MTDSAMEDVSVSSTRPSALSCRSGALQEVAPFSYSLFVPVVMNYALFCDSVVFTERSAPLPGSEASSALLSRTQYPIFTACAGKAVNVASKRRTVHTAVNLFMQTHPLSHRQLLITVGCYGILINYSIR